MLMQLLNYLLNFNLPNFLVSAKSLEFFLLFALSLQGNMNMEKVSFIPNGQEIEMCEVRKRITLVKRKLGGLGFLLRRNSSSAPHITNIVKGGEAEARGVEVGYVIETGGLSYGQIVDRLARVPVGKPVTISFKIIIKKKIGAKAGKMDGNQTVDGGKARNGTSVLKNETSFQRNEMANQYSFKDNGSCAKSLATDRNANRLDLPHAKHDKKYIKLQNWITQKETIDTLHLRSEVNNIVFSLFHIQRFSSMRISMRVIYFLITINTADSVRNRVKFLKQNIVAYFLKM